MSIVAAGAAQLSQVLSHGLVAETTAATLATTAHFIVMI